MTMPQRLQRSRRKGAKLPAGTVCVTRGTRFGNPWRSWRIFHRVPYRSLAGPAEWIETDHELTPREATERFRAWLADTPAGREMAAAAQVKLAGRDLACWCPLPASGEPDTCHAAVLIRLANEAAPGTPEVRGEHLLGEVEA